MNSNIARQRLIKGVQEEFTRTFPFLKIEFARGRDQGRVTRTGPPSDAPPPVPGEDEELRRAAQKLLWEELGFCDDMKINEAEVLLQYQFGLPAQVLRKSGNLWLETKMTQHWTLRQQNDHGFEIGQSFR